MRKLWMTVWLLATVTTYAVLPPDYLSVPHFKQCLATADQGTWQSWCVPQVRPKDCPCSSWLALQNGQTVPPHCHQPLSIWQRDFWRAKYQTLACKASSATKCFDGVSSWSFEHSEKWLPSVQCVLRLFLT